MKKIIAMIAISAMAVSLTACGSSSNTSGDAASATEETEGTEETVEEKVYVDESEYASVFTNPDDYKGKYIVLTGRVFTSPEENDDIVAYQAMNDTENYENNFIFYASKDQERLSQNDYFIIDGEITGAFSGENYFGTDIECPLIENCTVTKSNYKDVVVPTLKEITPAVSQEQNGVTISVDKIEYAEKETRVFLTVTNNSDAAFSYSVYSVRLIQNGQQIEEDSGSMSAYEGDYAELSYDVSPGASTSGVLVFPAIDQTAGFQIVVPDCYSDNFEVDFSDYTFDIAVQ